MEVLVKDRMSEKGAVGSRGSMSWTKGCFQTQTVRTGVDKERLLEQHIKKMTL